MAPTAYMLFCHDNRETVRQKLLLEGHEKVAVTVVAKELGQLWKTLSDEDKAKYKTQAEEQKQQQAAEKGEQQGGDGDEQQQHGDSPVKAATLPASWVRKVVNLDADIQRCSADGVMALSAAAEVFLAAVCAKATAGAAGAKRRTVRLDDIERCVRGDKRLVSAGLNAVLSMVAAAAAAAEETKAAAPPPGKKQKVDRPAPPAISAKNNTLERAFGLA